LLKWLKDTFEYLYVIVTSEFETIYFLLNCIYKNELF
jgi:hypothetical protein